VKAKHLPGPGREEAGLLAQAMRGDGEAFDLLVARHQDRIFGLLLRMVGDEGRAEDLAQECFMRAWRALGEFRGGSAFYTWLYRIALNLARSEGRTERRRREVEVPVGTLSSGRSRPNEEGGDDPGGAVEVESLAAGPDELAHRREMVGRVQEALGELPGEYREVVVLRDVEGLDYDEIAALVGASREAVKSRLHRAREELAGRLRRMGCEL
jgi:RNA polymerase sigma-70 factor (ECF subfamily)